MWSSRASRRRGWSASQDEAGDRRRLCRRGSTPRWGGFRGLAQHVGGAACTPPDVMDLLARQLLFVTGKGGVGKSTVSAALAWLGATSGKRTLAIEVDPKGKDRKSVV